MSVAIYWYLIIFMYITLSQAEYSPVTTGVKEIFRGHLYSMDMYVML